MRSKGVTNFGAFFIIIALYGFFASLLKSQLTVYGVITYIVLLVLGIYILKLKEWARKGIIYWYIISVPLSMVMFWLNLPEVNNKLRERGLNQLSSLSTVGLFIISSLIIISVAAIIIYFFTRPKVKEQFK